VAIAGVGLVVYQLGPLLSSRDQRQLLSSYRTQVARASHETQGLQGVSTSTKAPDLGSPVGVMEIGALRLQSVVVEGVSAANDASGRKLKFLRRIPIDPMTKSTDWGKRSYQDRADSTSWGGQNVFEVYTTSDGVGLDGTKYKDW